jgi:hypothetical protein
VRASAHFREAPYSALLLDNGSVDTVEHWETFLFACLQRRGRERNHSIILGGTDTQCVGNFNMVFGVESADTQYANSFAWRAVSDFFHSPGTLDAPIGQASRRRRAASPSPRRSWRRSGSSAWTPRALLGARSLTPGWTRAHGATCRAGGAWAGPRNCACARCAPWCSRCAVPPSPLSLSLKEAYVSSAVRVRANLIERCGDGVEDQGAEEALWGMP